MQDNSNDVNDCAGVPLYFSFLCLFISPSPVVLRNYFPALHTGIVKAFQAFTQYWVYSIYAAAGMYGRYGLMTPQYIYNYTTVMHECKPEPPKLRRCLYLSQNGM